MKTTLLALSLLCATAAFGQTASIISNEPQPIHVTSHQLVATQQPLQAEQSLLFKSSNVTSASGERPLWEVGAKPAAEIPLGDIARYYRDQHFAVKKAVKTLEK